ncbi:MAG: S8 family serine peptidase, partial [Limnobacter sp.]|nr:S8 family serine peptidase [Limnobacter sp.]
MRRTPSQMDVNLVARLLSSNTTQLFTKTGAESVMQYTLKTQVLSFLVAPLLGVSFLALPSHTQAAAESKRLLSDRYIVVLKAPSVAGIQPVASTLNGVIKLLPLEGAKITHKYDSALFGFAATMPEELANKLRQHRLVDYVEQDQVLSLDATQNRATWGLDRLDERAGNYDRKYTYRTGGQGVHAYILDSGLNAQHSDFTGRVGKGFDATNGSRAGGDQKVAGNNERGGLLGGGLLGGGDGGLLGGGLLGQSPKPETQPEPEPAPNRDPLDP